MSSSETGHGGYRPSERTVPTRAAERAVYDRELVHAVLDEGRLCHLGFVRDGAPVVLPTLYARVGERLYVHGSTGSRPLRAAGEEAGLPVCLTVTLVDALVLARSAFHHSVNYRSVVVHGTARQVLDAEERSVALDALVDHVMPGRAADCRPGDAKELAATAVLGDRPVRGLGQGALRRPGRRAGGPRPAALGGRAAGVRRPRHAGTRRRPAGGYGRAGLPHRPLTVCRKGAARDGFGRARRGRGPLGDERPGQHHPATGKLRRGEVFAQQEPGEHRRDHRLQTGNDARPPAGSAAAPRRRPVR